MCAAVPVGILLLVILAALTLMRLISPRCSSPNTELLTSLLEETDDPPLVSRGETVPSSLHSSDPST